jgi:agmatine deiminase
MLEEAQAVFVEIARAILPFESVLVVAPSLEYAQSVMKDLPQDNIRYAIAPTNDTWARDHGGIGVLDGDKPLLLDFVFNGWGLKFAADKDNLITSVLAQQDVFKAPKVHGGLVLEGGALESDGQGTLLTTTECLLSPNRNPHLSQLQIEQELKRLLGLDRILWLNHGFLEGDDTDSHIDTLARFCTPDTIAYVKCSDPEDVHYGALQAMEIELKGLVKKDGSPYTLVPLPWPDACFASDGHRLPATYANFLIINEAVLVPTYRVSQDAEALSVLQTVFPDRKIIGIDCRPLIEQHGSLHCVTMQYPLGFV